MKIRASWALFLGLPGWNKLTKVYVSFKLVKKVEKISDKITCLVGPPGPKVYVFLLGGVFNEFR